MEIAVTGGSGFLGQAAITAAQQAGHDAWSFDRSRGDDVLGSLDGLRDADAVIHLAGMLGTSELFDDPEAAIQVNVVGTLRILQWCRAQGAVYVGVTMPHVFPSVYTATKVCAQRLATAWHLAYDMPVSHVRAFNAYGPHQAYGPGHPQKILPTFARAGWEGRPLPVWGDGEQTMDLVHADDVGRMLVEATGHGDDSVFDAGTGQPVTVNELAAFVLDVTGSNAGIEYLPMRPGETPTQIVAKGSGWSQLGWKPEFDWDRVADAVVWYRDAR
jgi:UDP-glucose 4-epimerase